MAARAGSCEATGNQTDGVEWHFSQAAAAHVQQDADQEAMPGTDASLADLLSAARLLGRLKAGGSPRFAADAFGRLRDCARVDGLEALVEQAALLIDQAQVSAGSEIQVAARIHALKAAVFAADLAGDTRRMQSLEARYAALRRTEPVAGQRD